MSGDKLNVGCGKDIQQGWINLDSMALPGFDMVFDLQTAAQIELQLGTR